MDLPRQATFRASGAASAGLTMRARLAGSPSDEAVLFLQRRSSNAGLFGACFASAFVGLRIVTSIGEPGNDLAETSFWFHVASVVPLSFLWLYCRQGQRTERAIVVAEVACITLAAAFVIAMGATMPLVMRPDMVVLMALSTLLTARAIYVPSTARRTLLISLLATPPFLGMVFHSFGTWSPALLAETLATFERESVFELRVIFVIVAAAWWSGSTAVCVAASKVIYGLREEVREVKRLGQYGIEEKLGEGGMGVVYRAHHGLLQRPTAIKLLPPDRVGQQGLERFEREVRQTARLTHPNTITIYDYGHTPDGVFYYAMELLDGVTLDRVIEETGPMPPARVLHVLRQAAGSLAEAHGIGLVHRDIKPENIMLCAQGGVADTVKVLDFGLVKEMARGKDARLTGDSVILGTPQYMAPESIVSNDVDARADLYSLAATGYFLLTGRDVFEADSVVELCAQHLKSEPVPPSRWVEVPADLEQILLRCLAKKPEQRPAHGRELSRLLAQCDDAEGWTEDDAEAWWQEHGRRLARPGGVSTTAPTVLASAELAP